MNHLTTRRDEETLPQSPRPVQLVLDRRDAFSDRSSSFSIAQSMGRPMVPAPASQRPQLRGLKRGWIITGIVIVALVLIAVIPGLRASLNSSTNSNADPEAI